jgi:N-acetylneuraminic acid mutarotase
MEGEVMEEGRDLVPCVSGWYEIQHDSTNPDIPCPRSLHSCVGFETNIYIFGGYDGMQRKNDFYFYNIDKNRWKEIKTHDMPPSPRDRHVAVVHSRSIFIFGGYDGFNRVNDFYEYNIDYNSWQEVLHNDGEVPPTPRHSHSSVVYEDSMYIFGGYDGHYKNDFHRFNFITNTWTNIKDSRGHEPTPRYRTACTVINDGLYLFGGHDGAKQLNDFFTFNFKTQEWSQINYERASEPSPRDSHILLSFENSILLFGGSSGNARSDFFEYRIEEGRWHNYEHAKGTRPSCRFCHVGIVIKKRLYVFGGYDGENRLNDFHYFVLADEESAVQ